MTNCTQHQHPPRRAGHNKKYTEGLSTAKNPKPFCILVYFMYD